MDVLQLIRTSNNGRALSEIEKQLVECTAATMHTGGDSTVTIKIKTRLAESNIDVRGTCRLDVTVESKGAPAAQTLPANTLYVDREMRISRSDPNQMNPADLKRAGERTTAAVRQARENIEQREAE